MTNLPVALDDTVVAEHQIDYIRKNTCNDVPVSNTEADENIEHDDQDDSLNDKSRGHLSAQETWNIIFCFLAWACNVSIVTLGKFVCSFYPTDPNRL
jgi:hypothetical protein